MLIGVPKETRPQENRIGVVPSGVRELVAHGHRVIVQQDGGTGSGISDAEYIGAGAEIVSTAEEVWARGDMIWKVNAPLEVEYPLMKEGQILYAFLHLAPNRGQTDALLARGVSAFAYETVCEGLCLPLLAPMSEVAGRLSVQVGAHCLELNQGGRGVLLGGVPGVPPARVTVLGGGIVGRNAVAVAAGMGADVTVMDLDLEVLRRVDARYRGRVKTLFSNPHNIETALAHSDLVIGGVLTPGARSPVLVSRAHLSLMKPGAAIVDVAVDQGGCVETTRPTTHAAPTHVVDGIVHYGVPNMPGAVARTSTFALANATLPYGVMLADLGWKKAVEESAALRSGLNVCGGKITSQVVAAAHDLPHAEV